MMTTDASTIERMTKWIGFAMSVKSFMLEAGVRSHMEACPFCNTGTVTAALAGGKDHLVLACATTGCVRMRE